MGHHDKAREETTCDSTDVVLFERAHGAKLHTMRESRLIVRSYAGFLLLVGCIRALRAKQRMVLHGDDMSLRDRHFEFRAHHVATARQIS